jgi:hypothetical protein
MAEPTLVGYARLPADTFRSGPTTPTSGQFIEAENAPFVDKQPVQGISSLVPIPDEPGSYYALSDNGFGSKANSADYLLCVYKVTPDFETGEVAWELAFHLSDPNDVIDWPTVADGETYPGEGGGSDIPVPAVIRDDRLLTGADFDVESMVLLPDGTFWIGDEFGPFLLHFDGEGRLLEPSVDLPGEDMHSPDHPTKDPATAKIGRSAGFEGIELAVDWTGEDPIMAFLEKRLPGEEQIRLAILVTDPKPSGAASGLSDVTYPLPAAAEAIGGTRTYAVETEDGGFRGGLLILERDGQQAAAASHKYLALASMMGRPDRPELYRWPLADLLDLADPDDLDGDGKDRFRFPYLTIESVAVVDERTVIVCNDNNFPFTDGRPERPGPDATEFILIRFDKPISELAAP